jgi:nucleoside-diphosphate-sugar epimerase
VIRGSVADFAVAREATDGCDGVFHEAALGSVPRSVEFPLDSHLANATGTVNVLTACRDTGVRRFVFAGSSSVFGALAELPKREDHPVAPISPYGVTKLVGEEYARVFRELYDLETVVLRYYNVFGPRQNPEGQYAAVIPLFISAVLDGEAPVVHGDGEQSRDFTYVSNVVDANLLAMEAPSETVAAGLFNVAAGGRISLNRLIALLGELHGVGVTPQYVESRPGDIKHSQADVSRFAAATGYRVRVPFEEGIRLTYEYFRDARG